MMKSKKSLSKFVAIIWVTILGCLSLPVQGQIAVRNQGFVPFSEEPINYRSGVPNDPVARLQKRLDSGEVALEYEPEQGYLKSVLHNLKIPVSSQTLVFSKTSFQYKKISPQTPRALYFNDDVYVGWVRDGKVLEIVSFDPMQGAIFYILDEQNLNQQATQKPEHPTFQRAELDCIQCHVAASTRGVPGVLLRSVYANPSGTQATQATSFITGHESPLKDRWGGWYITGTHGRQVHMGNVVVQDKEHPEKIDRAAGANFVSLAERFDVSHYLTAHSDIVAHLVQAHQTQMHNLITLTNYQTRLALYAEANRKKIGWRYFEKPSDETRKQYETPAEELLGYLLFINEAPLTEQIKGASGFTEEFAALGARDSLGRSLRDFDLNRRIFKYPCSYLIYSEAFDALPEPAKSYIYRRLLEVLTERDQSPEFARLTREDKRAILEILLATKTGLPEEWNRYRKPILSSGKDPKQDQTG
jgi:hypothetical protein